MDFRSERGFTLLELMVVAMIIGILAALSIYSYTGNLPKAHLNEVTGEVQMLLMKTRMEAVRNYRYEKVCIFRDDNANDDVPRGRVLRFHCTTTGESTCSTTMLCDATKNATGATLFTAAGVDCATDDMWCQYSGAGYDLDYGAGVVSRKHVSIAGFGALTATAPDLTKNMIEITYGPTGTVNTGRSSLTFTQGRLFTTNYELCTPGVPPNGTCSGFSRMNNVSWVLGGPVRVEVR